jgi:hypothetical protein
MPDVSLLAQTAKISTYAPAAAGLKMITLYAGPISEVVHGNLDAVMIREGVRRPRKTRTLEYVFQMIILPTQFVVELPALHAPRGNIVTITHGTHAAPRGGVPNV